MSFIKSINKMKGVLTTITIAHNMSTVINCDKIILMNEGKVVSFGHYNELVKNSLLFKNLARS